MTARPEWGAGFRCGLRDYCDRLCARRISVTASRRYTGTDKAITAVTDHGIEELTDMIRAAHTTTKTWHEFLDDFVEDADLVARTKAKSMR